MAHKRQKVHHDTLSDDEAALSRELGGGPTDGQTLEPEKADSEHGEDEDPEVAPEDEDGLVVEVTKDNGVRDPIYF